MKNKSTGKRLIAELLSNPIAFYEKAETGVLLLEEYFNGMPLETLRPLLSSPERIVRRVAVWIASELGKKGKPLLDSVSPLVHDEDPHIRVYALELIAVCAEAEEGDKYASVVRSLEDSNDYIRAHSMFMISNAAPSQLQATTQSLGRSPSDDLHKQGLSQLLLADRLPAEEISSTVRSAEPLLRKYGAIAAWRCRDKFPDLISDLASTADQDIKRFWEQRSGR